MKIKASNYLKIDAKRKKKKSALKSRFTKSKSMTRSFKIRLVINFHLNILLILLVYWDF